MKLNDSCLSVGAKTLVSNAEMTPFVVLGASEETGTSSERIGADSRSVTAVFSMVFALHSRLALYVHVNRRSLRYMVSAPLSSTWTNPRSNDVPKAIYKTSAGVDALVGMLVPDSWPLGSRSQ
jgi:hypothetical protein